jgi:hypothetical protein
MQNYKRFGQRLMTEAKEIGMRRRFAINKVSHKKKKKRKKKKKKKKKKKPR